MAMDVAPRSRTILSVSSMSFVMPEYEISTAASSGVRVAAAVACICESEKAWL